MIDRCRTLLFYTNTSTFIITLLVAMIFISCNESEDPDPNDDNMGGTMGMDDEDDGESDVAPDFSLESLEGSTIKLADYGDQVVVLFFLGYSCPNCISSAPSIEEQIAKAFQSNKNFAILGLDQWDGNKSGLQSFKNSTGVSFPLLLKASGTASEYNTTYDRLIIVDKSGKIAYQSNTSAGGSINAVKEKLNELL